MKKNLIVMLLTLAVLCFTVTASATPLPEDLSGYYKFGYFGGNTFVAKVEMGIGAIKARVLAEPDVLHLGIIVGDKIYFGNSSNSSRWGVLSQINEDTALMTIHNADTGETFESTVVKLNEAEAQEIIETNRQMGLEQGCINNMKQLGLALHLFARDHDGELPSNLEQLYPNYATGKDLFVCPVDGDQFVGFDADYEYIPGFRVDSPNPGEEIVVVENLGNHPDPGSYYVLYLDGHVERKTTEGGAN